MLGKTRDKMSPSKICHWSWVSTRGGSAFLCVHPALMLFFWWNSFILIYYLGDPCDYRAVSQSCDVFTHPEGFSYVTNCIYYIF